MIGANIKLVIGVFVYSLICFFVCVGFVQCSEKKAQEQIREAKIESESAKSELFFVNEENANLKDIIKNTNAAVERTLLVIMESQSKHEERIEEIESDPEAIDWLKCDLPDSVRNAFKDYCRNEDGINSAPEGVAQPLPKANSISNRNK